MKSCVLIGLVSSIGLILSGCQSSQSRQQQLATICADPNNRQPKSEYWGECQSLYPSSNKQLQKDYLLGAPAGD
jgi:hypothetical protein